MLAQKAKPKSAEGVARRFKMRLYLMRHGIAVDRDDPECPEDTQRYLTPKGVARTQSAARGLAELGVKPTALLTSPYVRAVQTGEIVCEILDINPKDMRVTDALKPNAEPAGLVEELESLSALEVMCFGHAPHLNDFIAQAAEAHTAFTELKKAGVACLDVETFSPLHAIVTWILTSKVLRALGD